MEEGEYRSIYHKVNECRCEFEKSILTRKCMCSQARRFNLADREGVACRNTEDHALCKSLLQVMRQKALFALKLTRIDGQLPHAKEVKVQTGGLIGLARLLSQSDPATGMQDIIHLVKGAIEKYGELSQLPYDELSKEIVQYQGRRKRHS